jgi:hypothetical protein
MRMFTRLLERKLIEELTGSPNWETTWWTDVVFRGLQEGERDEIDVELVHGRSPANRRF